MNKKFLILLSLLLAALPGRLAAQDIIPVSVRDLAPEFGLRPQFLDDTIHWTLYLDSLSKAGTTAPALTDSCVSSNARLMALSNVIQYDYRHFDDTVWIDASHYLEDYDQYAQRIQAISSYLLARAHGFIEQEHRRKDALQQNSLNLRKDTVDSYHRTIVNACEGIGVSDKDRKKELKDIYYCYLSVYNRYDLSMRRGDSAYLADLDHFCKFQRSIIDNLLSNNNYTVRINNFSNTLRMRCGRNHTDVLRSYQRVFRKGSNPVSFSTIDEYYTYLDSQQEIVDIQNCYLEAIDRREQIDATSKRICSLYGNKFHDVSKVYQEVAATLNTVPSFLTMYDARVFLANLAEFSQVQQCYIEDYHRLMTVQQHGDSIVQSCSVRYSDIAKAYRQIADINSMTPHYQTLDDARRFDREIDRFELIQRQYDSILFLRRDIDDAKDTICKGWMSHIIVYNGYQTIRKQYVLTPTFIDEVGGTEFIDRLIYFNDIQNRCLQAIDAGEQYKQLDDQISSASVAFKNIRKAYSRLQKDYLTIKAINHTSELDIYNRQLQGFIAIQQSILNILRSNSAADINNRLAGIKDNESIILILGLQ